MKCGKCRKYRLLQLKEQFLQITKYVGVPNPECRLTQSNTKLETVKLDKPKNY